MQHLWSCSSPLLKWHATASGSIFCLSEVFLLHSEKSRDFMKLWYGTAGERRPMSTSTKRSEAVKTVENKLTLLVLGDFLIPGACPIRSGVPYCSPYTPSMNLTLFNENRNCYRNGDFLGRSCLLQHARLFLHHPFPKKAAERPFPFVCLLAFKASQWIEEPWTPRLTVRLQASPAHLGSFFGLLDLLHGFLETDWETCSSWCSSSHHLW